MGYSVDETFPASGDWLKANDLKRDDGTYGSTSGVIESVRTVDFDDGTKFEVTFSDSDKKFVANKTNSKNIAMAFGDKTDGWTGKTLRLSVHQTPKGPGILATPVQGTVQEEPVAAHGTSTLGNAPIEDGEIPF